MSRNGYRLGKAQVNLVIDPELRDRMRRKAVRHGRSMQEEWLLAAAAWLGEEVPDAGGGVGSRRGVQPASGGSGFGRDPGVAGGVSAGVGPRGSDDPVDPFPGVAVPPPAVDWDALMARGREAKTSTISNTVLQSESDPLEDIA